MKRFIFVLLSVLLSFAAFASDTIPKTKIYSFPIREEIMPAAWRLTDKCMAEAEHMGADYIIIDMNTYGGLLDVADSIRTRILNSDIPVIVFINNEAASAGALISIAADSIYIRPGGSIGAATVVNGTDGAAMPDKYQSFMRSMMRSTAQSHGQYKTVTPTGDTIMKWYRDPLIAEAMVDSRTVVPGLSDSTKVLTLTAAEALEWGYSEGNASSVEEVISKMNIKDYTLTEYRKTTLDNIIGWLTSPVLQGIFIMMILGGIYFELQTPGIGFPLGIAILGALLYFAPLYIEGVAESWELLIFVIGIILIGVEIFVLPGFGVAGIAGIGLTMGGLILAMIDNELFKHIGDNQLPLLVILNPILTVIISCGAAIFGSIYLTAKFMNKGSALGRKVVLTSKLDVADGFIGTSSVLSALVGREAVCHTALRPSGKVEIDGRYYDAVEENGLFIERGQKIIITSESAGNLYCHKLL